METCEWTFDAYSGDDTHTTECGEIFITLNGSVKDNNFKYCPFCGKKIELIELSPCCQKRIDNDMRICPTCKEHV